MQALIAALAASALSFAVLYLLLSRRIKRLVDPEAIVVQIRREIEELIVELNATTERDIGLLEDKIASVSAVLKEAEKRVVVLRRESAALEQRERAYAALRSVPDSSLRPPEASQPSEVPRIKASRRARAAPRERAAADAAPEREGGEEASVRERILSLHRAGISADSISKSTQVPRAKVELILALEEGAR